MELALVDYITKRQNLAVVHEVQNLLVSNLDEILASTHLTDHIYLIIVQSIDQ